MEARTFHLSYSSWAALQRDCRQQIAMRGMVLKTPEPLQQFAPVCLQLITPAGEEFSLPGEVVQVIAGKGVAVQFSAAATEAIGKLTALCQQRPTETVPAPGGDPVLSVPGAGNEPAPAAEAPAAEEADAPADLPAGDSQNLPKQIEAMSVEEKRRTALHGRKDMRLLLIRDRNKTIHPFVIKNPAITLDEIEQIAKMPGVNPEVLRMIAGSMEWTRSTTVCRNLVHNPKTPLREALLLLQKLPQGDIRALAKSANVRTPIQHAARKIVTG